MKISYEDHGAVSVLTLSGEFTADQGDAFRRSCEERLGTGVRHVVLNVQYMNLIDSVGLESLLWLKDELADRNGQLRIVNPEDTVRKIFELTRLDRRFDVHASIESAARSLR